MATRSYRQTRIKQSIQGFFTEIHPKQLIPSLTAGSVLGILNITLSTSLAVLIFSGELSAYVPRGIGFILFGAMVIGFGVSITSSLPNTIAVPQEIPAAILAMITITFLKKIPEFASSDGIFVTYMAIIILTSLLTGVIFLLLGTLKLGNLTRFIPYPVIGGFLAGTGWLLVTGAINVMTDIPCDFFHAAELSQSVNMVKWMPGVLFGIILLIISRRQGHFMVMPLTIIAGIVGFFIYLGLTHTPIADAEARGWLLGPFPSGGLWQPLTFKELTYIQWSAINGQIWWDMGTIVLLGTISLLLNAAGLELAVRRDIDLNRELVSAGAGNILSGFGGGIVGFHTLSDTALGHKIAPNSRVSGLFAAFLCGVALFFGASVLSFFPRFLTGGLIFYLGLSFLVEWGYDAWRKLPKTDCILILAILLVVGTAGFLAGVFFGMFMTLIIFVINYSRINVVKNILNGQTFQSTVERAVIYRKILQKKGGSIAIFKLQGFIFFGTANTLYQQIWKHIIESKSSEVRFLVLDFRLVNGLDSSALNSFLKLKQRAESQDCILVLTHLLPEIRQLFEKAGFTNDMDPLVRIFQNADCGVEWCEEQILSVEASLHKEAIHPDIAAKSFDFTAEDIKESLDRKERFELVIEDLGPYLERREHNQGDYIIKQGDMPEALYFIESGQVVVQLEDDKGAGIRLRTMNEGTVVGELGIYLNQQTSASVIMNQRGVTSRLSNRSLQRMKLEDPQKLIRFHEFLVHLLSERLVNTNNTLNALLD